MIQAIKKLFIWTPSDVAAWEKIRARGFGRFVLGYGMFGFGGLLFLVTGIITLVGWVLSPAGFVALLFRLAVSLGVCLLGGLIAGLLTWWLEDGIYRWIKKSR